MLPLPAATVSDITYRLSMVKFKQLYGAFEGKDITDNADEIVRRSGKSISPALDNRAVYSPLIQEDENG